MTERDPKTGCSPDVRLKRLLCKRTGEKVDPREHERCPYCFGKLAEIGTGQHDVFCDYREGVDPVHFGFPENSKRSESG